MAITPPVLRFDWRAAIALLALHTFRLAWAKTGPAPVEICAKLKASGRPPESTKGCGDRWAIMNAAVVTEYWEVHELRFFWDSTCTVGVPNSGAFQSSVMSTMLENVADMVFDSNLYTRWSANCRVLLGGCPRYREYVGIDSTGYNKINFSPDYKYANVRCTRVFQSPNVTKQASKMALATWVNETDYHIVEEYHTFTGGVWQKRPAMEHGLWRLWNNAKTVRPWRVAEFMFYSDIFCTRQETGVVISSWPFLSRTCINDRNCDEFEARNAVDGITLAGKLYPEAMPTFWMANCHETKGCKKDEAFIGLDFGESPVTIRCIRLYQPTADVRDASYATALRLDSWNGYKWLDQEWYYGLSPGGYNDTRPLAKTAWRIANFDRVQDYWEVYELGFFEDIECGTKMPDGSQKLPLSGLPISANPLFSFAKQSQTCRLRTGSCAGLAFDKLTDTAWTSSCTYCAQRESWIGMQFRVKGGVDIKCFKVWQGGVVRRQSEAIELAYWTGTDWSPTRLEVGIGGGTWNFRPAVIGSMFRLLSNAVTEKKWTLIGIQFYNDSRCLDVMQGLPLVSGSMPLDPVDGAFDEDDLTYWEASCSPPAPDKVGCALNSAWLGVQGFKDAIDVKCLRIQQHRSRERQVTSLRAQQWDGISWKVSPRYTEPINEIGGGTWQMLPGARGSQWRLAATPAPGGLGFAVSELEFYRSTDCTTGAVKQSFPNIMPIGSAFATSREVSRATGYVNHVRIIGDFASTSPDLAFDGNMATFFADLTTKHQSWVGLDVTTQVVDIHCARVSPANIKQLQCDYSEIQAWDGMKWATISTATSPYTRALPIPANNPFGSGWLKRPAPARSMWRLQNDIDIQGWEIMEVEFYQFVDCSGSPLKGVPISSLPVMNAATPEGGHMLASAVYDLQTSTRWSAACHCKPGVKEEDCGVVHGRNCKPGEAWIGLDTSIPTITTCFRIIQSGQRYLQSSRIALGVWSGDDWTVEASYRGFGGETWNMRPAAPDTLWRIALVKQKTELCKGHGRGLYMRSWAVSELEFFSDDKCKKKLPGRDKGTRVIVSGTREPQTAIRAKKPQFDPNYILDGNLKTYWAAQCGVRKGSDEAFCAEGYEWVGMDFSDVDGGAPKDVRCFKVHQNRASRRECCDPAEEIKLERWNGTDWTIAQWKHLKLKGAEPMIINASFQRMGVCPSIISNFLPGGSDDYWEERRRRQADDCVIPLAASVKLLSDPLCAKHDVCVGAGFKGKCCPSAPSIGGSRCCCDFLVSNEVFEDELSKDAYREPVETAPIAGLELVVIRSVVVLPFFGLVISLLLLILGNIPKPKATSCLWRSWVAVCGPLQQWMAEGASPAAVATRMMIVRYEGEKPWLGRLKMVSWLVFGFAGGGVCFYVLISYVIAELMIKFTVLLSMVIPMAKSPYRPGDPADRKRMVIMLALPFTGDGEDDEVRLSDSPLGKVASQAGAAIAMSLCYILRAMFDFILMRFAVLALDLVDVQISVPDILYAVPKLPIDIKPLQDFMYNIVNLSTKVFQEAFLWLFEGVPRCEGPVILFSGMWLVAVTLVLIRWLNYDLFGIFTGTKNVIAQTRPMFQKTCGIATMLGIQSGMFLFMQCIMLLFTRALKLVNPMEKSNQNWVCPYDGDFMSILVGRILITSAAAVALVITFLCANGHFLGQDYIVREYGNWLGLNLSGLDPDGVGDEGGFIRFDSILAMLPTTFGIWIDGWNVRGYLIKERALVYAEELELPVECPFCECAHVPYNEIMRATGMQLSLAYQLAPCGAIIGKACEYLNNPPLFYWGSELKCFHAHRHMRHVLHGVPKKLSGVAQCGVWMALGVAFFKDMFFPFLVRMSSLGMYTTLVYLTFMVDKQNVKDMAYKGFQLISALAVSKACLEFVLPAILVIIFFFVMAFTPGTHGADKKRQKKSLVQKEVRNAWPCVGAVVNGMACGIAVCLYFMVDEPVKLPKAIDIIIGTVAGIVGCIISLYLALILEKCLNSRFIGASLLFIWLIGSSIGLGYIATTKYPFVQRFIISILAAIFLVGISSYSFWPPAIGRGGPKMTVVVPAIAPVLGGPRILSAPVGAVAGVFVMAMMHEMCIRGQGEYWGLFTAMLCGLIAAVIYTLATDAIIEKRSSQIAITVGTFLSLIFGINFEWYIGVIIGTVVGCILGAICEHMTMKAVMEETVLMQPGDAKLQRHTSRADLPPPSPPGAKAGQGLPTLCNAAARGGEEPGLYEVKALSNTAVFENQNSNDAITNGNSATMVDNAIANVPISPNAPAIADAASTGNLAMTTYSNANAGQTLRSDATLNPSDENAVPLTREERQHLMGHQMRGGARKSKRFGMKELHESSMQSPQTTGMQWRPMSPTSNASPSSVAMTQGWVGNDGRGNGSARSLSAGARGATGSARGAAQGGSQPISPGGGRQVAVVRAASYSRNQGNAG